MPDYNEFSLQDLIDEQSKVLSQRQSEILPLHLTYRQTDLPAYLDDLEAYRVNGGIGSNPGSPPPPPPGS